MAVDHCTTITVRHREREAVRRNQSKSLAYWEIMRGASTVTIVLLGALCFTCATYGQTQTSSDQVLLSGRAALQQRHYAEAIHLLEDGLKRFPADRALKVELGRAYLYNRQDDQAMQLFREVLREEPSNRVAKLELARALAYQRDYEASDVAYRELLNAGPDEAAEAGLVHNLMHEHTSTTYWNSAYLASG
jgi:tetratricopeptide (TPR) repeat protein